MSPAQQIRDLKQRNERLLKALKRLYNTASLNINDDPGEEECAALDEARIAGTISYRRVSSPEEFVQELAPALAHWFNHQTHHRGQAHALITAAGEQTGDTDLFLVI